MVVRSELVCFSQWPPERVFLRNNSGPLTPSRVTAGCRDGPWSPRKPEGQGVALLGLTAQWEGQGDAAETQENAKAPHC